MVSCIIVDDIKSMVESLEIHVKAKAELDLRGSFTKPLEALDYLREKEIDLIFLDIEMPIVDGLDFIERVKNFKLSKMPAFILTTGFSKYAVESYEYEVIDYIIKPITFKRFNIAIEKYKKLKSIITEQPYIEQPDFLFVENKEKTKKVKVKFDDIIYIESDGNYITLYTDNERILIYKSLNAIQEVLDPNLFIRVYRSFIVAKDKIESIEGGELIMKINSHKKIPIGDFYKSKVMKQLNII
jgi:two-component system, LytTR family, response regulator